MSEKEKVARLQRAVLKLAGWAGNDISQLVESGMLEEGDLDD